MLSKQTAATLQSIAHQALGFDWKGDLVSVPSWASIAEVEAALRALDDEVRGGGAGHLVVSLLRKVALGRDPVTAHAALDMLTLLGEEPPVVGRDLTVDTGGVTLSLSGWVPLDVLDALVRLARLTGGGTPGDIADGVDVMADSLEAAATLIGTIDPSFDGIVSRESIEAATRRVAPLCAQPDGASEPTPQHEQGDVIDIRPRQGSRQGWHMVCAVERPIYAVTVIGHAAGVSLSGSEMSVMQVGEVSMLAGGESIILRTEKGWELWRK